MEQRLIDANYLLEHAWFCDLDHWGGRVVDEDVINEAPIIDAVPVRHSRWIHGFTFMPLPEGHIWANCEACGMDYRGLKEYANYCSNCGARMDLNE